MQKIDIIQHTDLVLKANHKEGYNMPYSVEEIETEVETFKQIVILDDTASPEGDSDIIVSLSNKDDVIYVRQQHLENTRADIIIFTRKMFEELIESYSKEPGFYNLEWNNG